MPAVRVSELACPFTPVVAVHDATADPPDERHAPPFEAARNVPVAVAPRRRERHRRTHTGFPKASVTNATNGLPNPVFTTADWLSPADRTSFAALPAVTAMPPTEPVIEAVTVSVTVTDCDPAPTNVTPFVNVRAPSSPGATNV